jgi:hypothetical protein
LHASLDNEAGLKVYRPSDGRAILRPDGMETDMTSTRRPDLLPTACTLDVVGGREGEDPPRTTPPQKSTGSSRA